MGPRSTPGTRMTQVCCCMLRKKEQSRKRIGLTDTTRAPSFFHLTSKKTKELTTSESLSMNFPDVNLPFWSTPPLLHDLKMSRGQTQFSCMNLTNLRGGTTTDSE